MFEPNPPSTSPSNVVMGQIIPMPLANNSSLMLDDNVPENDNPAFDQLDFEMLLAMNVDNGLPFEESVKSAMAESGNEFLFSFPNERFPISCINVACIKLLQQSSGENLFLYVYQEISGGDILVADREQLDTGYDEFARSFAGVMEYLREMFAPAEAH